jgi:hypothetical protein
VGSKVVLWGDGLPIDEVAAAAGTIGYELMCALAPARARAGRLSDGQGKNPVSSAPSAAASASRWTGQCGDCKAWNTMSETGRERGREPDVAEPP